MSGYNFHRYAPEGHRGANLDVSAAGIVAAASAGKDAAILVPSTKHTIFVQKVSVLITTAAAQTIIFRDDGDAIAVMSIESGAAAGTIRTMDFGAKGVALTEGKDLDIDGTAGPAYTYGIDAYAKQTSAGQSTTIARTI